MKKSEREREREKERGRGRKRKRDGQRERDRGRERETVRKREGRNIFRTAVRCCLSNNKKRDKQTMTFKLEIEQVFSPAQSNIQAWRKSHTCAYISITDSIPVSPGSSISSAVPKELLRRLDSNVCNSCTAY